MNEPASQSGPGRLDDRIRRGIGGAVLLARGRPEGLDRIAADPHAAPISFWAAAICLPAMLVLRLSSASHAGAGPSAHDILAPALLYAIGWAGYALLSHRIAITMDRQSRWPLFIAAWNWCNLVQYALFLAASLPGWAGAPAWLVQALGIVALCWAMWLQWFATRLALDVGPWRAVLMVVVDVLVGLFLTG